MSGILIVWTSDAATVEASSLRALQPMLAAMAPEDRARTTLMMVDAAADTASLRLLFPTLALVEVDTSPDEPALALAQAWQHPPAAAYSNTRWHWRSAVVYRKIAATCAPGTLEYLEFPDHGALGFCTLQERHLRGFLAGTCIAVRLSMSRTSLLHAEAQAVVLEDLNLSDLERKCLRDSDRIVAPLQATSAIVRETFGFAPAQWDPRVVLHPPSLPPLAAAGAKDRVAGRPRAIVSLATLRRLERPELFVRAVSALMRTAPLHVGRLVMSASGSDPDYALRVRAMVPPEFIERFEFLDADLPIAGSCVVLTGEFDMFGLRAYEASAQGACVVLNAANPAFGEGTPWIDGVNCFKFDGTVEGLVQALGRSFEDEPVLVPVQVPCEPWPWLVAQPLRLSWQVPAEPPIVSVVVSHHNLGDYVTDTVGNLLAQTYPEIEIIVVDDASTDPSSVEAIDRLVHDADPRVRVIHLPGNVGLPAVRNIGIREATGKYVLTIDADDLIHPNFIAMGVEALENGPDFDLVVTPAGYFLDGGPLPSSGPTRFEDYAVFSGEALLGGLIENRFSTATALFRRSALLRFPYLENLDCYEDWSIYMRMCDAGQRFIVTTQILFFYRRRQNSMVHRPRNAIRKRVEYSGLLLTSAPLALRAKSRHLLIGIASPAAGNEAAGAVADASEPAVLIHRLFGAGGQYDEQVAFGALKISRWLERKAPAAVGVFVAFARGMWRIYRSLGRQPR